MSKVKKPKVEKVELPAHIIENMDTQMGQVSGHTGGGIIESLDMLSGALAARDITFPCGKKTLWGDQLIVRVIKRKSPAQNPA